MNKSFLSTFIISCILLFSSSLFAGGLGIAFPFGFGTTDYDWYEADANHFGINFVFDTNVAKRSVFNYRLNFGVEFFNHEYDYGYSDPWGEYSYYYSYSHEGVRIVTDHAFGFGIVKSRVVRLWMGPNVRFGFLAGDEAGITLGGGITALGLNFNFGPVFTLGLEAGYLFNADIYFDSIDEIDTYYDYDTIDSGLNNMFVVKLVILFRINDTYDDFF